MFDHVSLIFLAALGRAAYKKLYREVEYEKNIPFYYGILSLVFGDLDINLGTITQEKDISGIYTSSRSKIPNGYGKIYSYLGGILPLKRGETPRTFDFVIGQGHVKQESDSFFIMDNENGLVVIKHFVEEKGTQIFESFTGDEIKENTIRFLIKIILFVGFLIGGLISFIWIIVDLIKFLISKINNKRSLNITQNSLIAKILNFVLVIFVLFLLFSERFKNLNQAKPFIFLIIILSASLMLLGLKIVKEKGKSKWLLLTVLTFSMINILYWQWYNFWI